MTDDNKATAFLYLKGKSLRAREGSGLAIADRYMDVYMCIYIPLRLSVFNLPVVLPGSWVNGLYRVETFRRSKQAKTL